jgi:hypothetical protein
MKLDEIITKINEGNKIEDLDIEVKKRLPIMEKIYLIEGYVDEEVKSPGLAEECTSIVDNIKKINYGMKEIMTVSTIMFGYTNIDVVCEGFYDKLMDSGIYDYVIGFIDSEDYNQFMILLENNIMQNINLFNNPMVVINRLITELINKIPDKKAINKIVKEIKNIDPKKMEELKEIVNRVAGQM